MVIVKQKGLIKKSVKYTLLGTMTAGLGSDYCKKPIPDNLYILGTTLVAVAGDHAEWIRNKEHYLLRTFLVC